MNSLRVEYLAILDCDGTFCADVASLNHLLQSDQSLDVQGNTIQFGGSTFSYDVQTGTTDDAQQRYFHIAVGCDDVGNRATFEGLLKSLRGSLFRLTNKEPQILWNDLGLYYAHDAYPAIHELENMMRKLITKFMLTTIGLGWTKEAIPKEVTESVKSKISRGSNYLQHIDFIQLSNFLFKPYTTADNDKILASLDSATNPADLNLDELRQLVPKSNWERYFSPLVDCESDYLRIRWERLYEFRNHVAHNRALSRSEHADIKTLVEEIRPKIEDAIAKLGDIKLTEVEKETVAENVAIGRHALNGEYIEYWKRVHENLLALALLATEGEEHDRAMRLGRSAPSVLNILKDAELISSQTRTRLRESFRLRNVIVHHSDVTFPDEKLLEEIEGLKEMLVDLAIRIDSFRHAADQGSHGEEDSESDADSTGESELPDDNDG
ncbi:MAG: hypothetical protein HQ582_16910 [Planctomycetes bacterium]|nr:hypothetical protein [Planctomycetota bacterium]